MLVYDMTNPKSFENLEHWRTDFLHNASPPDPGRYAFLCRVGCGCLGYVFGRDTVWEHCVHGHERRSPLLFHFSVPITIHPSPTKQNTQTTSPSWCWATRRIWRRSARCPSKRPCSGPRARAPRPSLTSRRPPRTPPGWRRRFWKPPSWPCSRPARRRTSKLDAYIRSGRHPTGIYIYLPTYLYAQLFPRHHQPVAACATEGRGALGLLLMV